MFSRVEGGRELVGLTLGGLVLAQAGDHDHAETAAEGLTVLVASFHYGLLHNAKVLVFGAVVRHAHPDGVGPLFDCLDFGDETVDLQIVDVFAHSNSFLLVPEDYAFHCFLFLDDFDPQSLEVARTNGLIVDFAQILLVLQHGSETLVMYAMAAGQSAHHFVADCPAFEAQLFGHDLVPHYAEFSRLFGGVILLQGGVEFDEEVFLVDFGEFLGLRGFLAGLEHGLLGLLHPRRHDLPTLVRQGLRQKSIVVPMLIAFIAQPAEIHPAADQTLENAPLDVLHAAAPAEGALVGGEAQLPPLQIFEDDDHGVLEVGAAHGAGDRHLRVFLVASPDLEALGVQTLLAGPAGGVALPVHFFVADGAHRIFLQRWKIILADRSLRNCSFFELLFLLLLLLALCEFELH